MSKFINIEEKGGRKVSIGFQQGNVYLLGNLPHCTEFALTEENAKAFEDVAALIRYASETQNPIV